MVVISCVLLIMHEVIVHLLPEQSNIVTNITAGAGAFVAGLLGHTYSKWIGSMAFASITTGILSLVPVGVSEHLIFLLSYLLPI